MAMENCKKVPECTCTEPGTVLVQRTQQREGETAPLCTGHRLQSAAKRIQTKVG